MSDFDLTFITEDETEYTIDISYTYDHRPVILATDPNDCCDDESGLEMKIDEILPSTIPGNHFNQIMESWDNPHAGSLYERAETLALKHYFEGQE